MTSGLMGLVVRMVEVGTSASCVLPLRAIGRLSSGSIVSVHVTKDIFVVSIEEERYTISLKEADVLFVGGQAPRMPRNLGNVGRGSGGTR